MNAQKIDDLYEAFYIGSDEKDGNDKDMDI